MTLYHQSIERAEYPTYCILIPQRHSPLQPGFKATGRNKTPSAMASLSYTVQTPGNTGRTSLQPHLLLQLEFCLTNRKGRFGAVCKSRSDINKHSIESTHAVDWAQFMGIMSFKATKSSVNWSDSFWQCNQNS